MANKIFKIFRNSAFCVFTLQVIFGCAAAPKAPTEDAMKVKYVRLEPQQVEGGKVQLIEFEEEIIAYREVIERSPNVKSVTRVTNNSDSDSFLRNVSMSPTDDSLVYNIVVPLQKMYAKTSSDKKGDSKVLVGASKYTSNLWKQDVGSFSKTRLTFGNTYDAYPIFSPDGKKIIFSSDRGGTYRTLWGVSIAGGGGITRLTGSMANDFAPDVSLKSDTLVYSSIPEGSRDAQIWTVEKNGSMLTQLREGIFPKFSPDGRKLLFLRKVSDNLCDSEAKNGLRGINQIWYMNFDGTAETQISTNMDYCILDASWSPDGKWIVYSANEGLDTNKQRNFDVWMMSSDGSNRQQLTTNGSMDIAPVWDRNGENIYFLSNRGGFWNIWRFSPLLQK